MTKANECTCPSGDGSLRHPCPAHPASVELAGVAANLTFINGRPAMCGCQVEYSSGGGEYSDVIYVTLCAKHSGSAILDLVATNRIALTPEYEGKWHADLYLDREIPLAKAEGATPAEAVLALMSAERIDPEQESVEQAGGDEREAAIAKFAETCPMTAESAAGGKSYDIELRRYYLLGWDDRAALAQPSPAQAEGAPVVGCLCGMTMTEGHHSPDGCCNLEEFAPQAQAEQAEGFTHFPELLESVQQMDAMLKAEVERPEVVGSAWRNIYNNGFDHVAPFPPAPGGPVVDEPLMTVAQHAASVARWAEMFNRVEQERDAGRAKIAELEANLGAALGLLRESRGFVDCDNPLNESGQIKLLEEIDAFLNSPVAQAQHSVPEEFIGRLSEFLAQRGATGKALLRELREMLMHLISKAAGD
ncbi:hypothetical protein [Pseudomonas aeruginosa]|uniref:hypothetical protein n=1 Tax=Pseudomonas aeruginosa TaxID=287 RepID=UPI001BCA1B58|nr:hypothetical protein [Pseudomonas aeruginosa]